MAYYSRSESFISLQDYSFTNKTRTSILLIVWPKCTLAASHAASGESRWVCRRDRQTDGQTADARPLHYRVRFPLDAASMKRVVLYGVVSKTQELFRFSAISSHYVYGGVNLVRPRRKFITLSTNTFVYNTSTVTRPSRRLSATAEPFITGPSTHSIVAVFFALWRLSSSSVVCRHL